MGDKFGIDLVMCASWWFMNGIQYSGDSVILDYEGGTVAQFGSQEGYFNSILNKNKLLAFRRAYPFLKDQDKICIS